MVEIVLVEIRVTATPRDSKCDAKLHRSSALQVDVLHPAKGSCAYGRPARESGGSVCAHFGVDGIGSRRMASRNPVVRPVSWYQGHERDGAQPLVVS